MYCGDGVQSQGGESLIGAGQAGQVGVLWPMAQGARQALNGAGMQSQNNLLPRLNQPLSDTNARNQDAVARRGSLPFDGSSRDAARDGRRGSQLDVGSPITIGRRGSQQGGSSPITVSRKGSLARGNSPINVNRRGSQLGDDSANGVGRVESAFPMSGGGRFGGNSPVFSISSGSQGKTEPYGGMMDSHGGSVEMTDSRNLGLNGNSPAIYMQSIVPMEQVQETSDFNEPWQGSNSAEMSSGDTAVAGPNTLMGSTTKPRQGIVVRT